MWETISHWMSQVLDEGCEGGSSGAEHAVALQRAEEPLQTGRFQQTHQDNTLQPWCMFYFRRFNIKHFNNTREIVLNS